MNLTVGKCTATKNSITITFSEAVHLESAGDTANFPKSAINPANYHVFDPNSVDFNYHRTVQDAIDEDGTSFVAAVSVPSAPPNTVNIKFTSSDAGQSEFQGGDVVLITIKNVIATSGDTLPNGSITLTPRVPGRSRVDVATKNVEDAISYPVLTEEVSYRPSPVGIQTGGGQGGGVGSLGQVAAKAVSDVLGWKPSATDPKGFIGALTQAFTLTDVEGHVESKWTPRTYAVQTDLGGGITGAQASLYTRAKNALDSVLPLLDGLYPLDPEADPEYVRSLREMARSQMSEIVKEFGVVGLPSILRIDTYFEILVGQNPAHSGHHVQFDPDKIKGTLGELRDTYGISFVGNKFNNSIEDEQDITNFRVISDYVTSLMQSWIANREFFRLGTKNPAFFGTQLVLISRQFTVIAETVNEVRFALDSVFIGPNERQSLLLEFMDQTFAPMFLEDLFEEIENFVSAEGPRLLKDGGKISVTNNVLPVVKSYKRLVEQAHEPANIAILPDGYSTSRVRNSLDDLRDQLKALIGLIEQVEQQVPEPEDAMVISGIQGETSPENPDYTLHVFGNGFDLEAQVDLHSTVMPNLRHIFCSPQRIDVFVEQNRLTVGDRHTLTVTNPDGRSVSFAFRLTDTSGNITPLTKGAKPLNFSIGTANIVSSAPASSAGSPSTSATPPPPSPEMTAVKAQMATMQKSQDQLSQKVDAMVEKMSKILENKNKEKHHEK